MPNTNFQTIHQMGGAINSFVKQATGRDAVQNIDIEHVTVAQNHYYEDVDISGRVVSFNAGAAGIPLEKCLVQIEPVQEGTGDPSPDNVRPISGWTKAKVFVSPTTDEADGTTYTIAFPAEAGTVYGGTLTIHQDGSGDLVVDHEIIDLGSVTWTEVTSTGRERFFAPFTGGKPGSKVICDCFQSGTRAEVFYHSKDNVIAINNDDSQFEIHSLIYENDYDAVGFKTQMSGHYAVYELATPVAYRLTNQQVIETLKGPNNIWADTGDIEVKFKNIKEFF